MEETVSVQMELDTTENQDMKKSFESCPLIKCAFQFFGTCQASDDFPCNHRGIVFEEIKPDRRRKEERKKK